MHFGLILECEHRPGATQEEAFEEVFSLVDAAEAYGLDGIWLAERHFAPSVPDEGQQGGALPSVVTAPLVMASAIAARTRRLRIGIGVSVLPLNHPVRMAEEAATVDNISQGRLDFGVGRSGFVKAYQGYGIPYSESKERFQECLEVIVKAWTNDSFSYKGRYYTFDDVCLTPKPYQKPHPPIRVAANSVETFPQIGCLGFPIFGGMRSNDLPELGEGVNNYRRAWSEAGHVGEGDVMLRAPVYVAETAERARSDTEVSTMRAHESVVQNLIRQSDGRTDAGLAERAERAQRMAEMTYDDLIASRMAYGTPEAVVERIREFDSALKLSGILAEMNVGGMVPKERVLNSLRLFCEQVIPKFN